MKREDRIRLEVKQEIINWLSSLIDTSIICLQSEMPSIPHDRLLFQLKSKFKELEQQARGLNKRGNKE